MKVGYVRVSTLEQNTGRQEVIMDKLGVEKVFIDKCSGKDTKRPQLNEMLDFVRDGDILVVESFSRLSRSTRDLIDIVDKLNAKGVQLESQKEMIDTSTPQGKFFLTIMGALNELERETIIQRQQEGILYAKQHGVKLGRPEFRFDDEQKLIDEFTKFSEGLITMKSLKQEFKCSEAVLYKTLRKYREEGKVPDRNGQYLK